MIACLLSHFCHGYPHKMMFISSLPPVISIYVSRSVCLRIVLPYTFCLVFLFCFSSSYVAHLLSFRCCVDVVVVYLSLHIMLLLCTYLFISCCCCVPISSYYVVVVYLSLHIMLLLCTSLFISCNTKKTITKFRPWLGTS
jgi:hypothetical protein